MKTRLREALYKLADTKATMESGFYNNVYDFIEREGCFFDSKVIITEETKFLLKRMRSVNQEFLKSQCYLNSFRMLLSDSNYRIGYVEGVICTRENPIPRLHAWNEIKGKVVDTTLQRFGEFSDDIAYYGVRMSTSIVRQIIIRNNFNGSIIDDDIKQIPVTENPFIEK